MATEPMCGKCLHLSCCTHYGVDAKTDSCIFRDERFFDLAAHDKRIRNEGITALEEALLDGQYPGWFFVVDEATRQHITQHAARLRGE